MAVLLCRVDERLIHGQVVIGWGGELHPDRYWVVDDDLAASEWEQDLYRLSLGDASEAEFWPVDSAQNRLGDWIANDDRGVLLTRDLDSMLRLASTGGLEGIAVNVGGIHHAAGRERVTPYVFLDQGDRERLRSLSELVGSVSARDLPSTSEVRLPTLLGDGA